MFNLAPIFDHAIRSFDEFGDALDVRPLPVTVYLMQRDVINHYRLALTHYFPISLSEPYLQDSSIGPPFEKWRKFANDDFSLLAFTIHNLIRYTSRLVYETVGVGLQKQKRFREIKDVMGDEYTSALCDILLHQRQIGIHIASDNSLEITPFAQELVGKRVEIGNRAVLKELCVAGHAEIEELIPKNDAFGKLCTAHQATGPIALPYGTLHQEWWV